MQPITFFSLAIVLASTGHSMPPEQDAPQAPIEDSSSAAIITNGSLAVVVEDLSPSAWNGSSLEDILNELHFDSRTKRNHGCQFSAGTYGGGGGGAFNELLNDCGATIRRIRIRSGRLVDGIQVTYMFSNGQYYTAGHHGGHGGRQYVININVNGGEKIIGIFGKSGSKVDQLGFVTNHGRIFGPYGGCGGGSFRVNSCHVRGIFGRSGSLLDSIGFFCSRL